MVHPTSMHVIDMIILVHVGHIGQVAAHNLEKIFMVGISMEVVMIEMMVEVAKESVDVVTTPLTPVTILI